MARLFDDASSQGLTITSSLGGIQNPLTMAIWFNADQTAADTVAMSLSSTGGATGSYRIIIAGGSAGDPVRVSKVNDAGSAAQADSTTGYSTGVWHHACGVFTSNTSRTAYIDGGSSATNTTNITNPTPDAFRIGYQQHSGAASAYFSGMLAHAAIWNVALTAAEVASLAKGIDPRLIRPDALIAYWPLIGRTSPEIDIVGKFDLTLTGTPTAADGPRIFMPRRRRIWVPGDATGAVLKTGADTLTPALTETPTLLSASTLADSLTPALADAAAVQAALSGADTLTPALTEATTLLVALSGADTLTPALAETAILLGLIDRIDTLTPALSESATLLVSVGASDTLTPSLAELATLLVALDATDTLTPALAEALDLLARLDRGDALTPALVETATLLGLIARTDTLTPTLAEAATLLAALDATDTLAPNLAEAVAVLVAVTGADTLTPALADTAAVLAIIGLAATPALQFVVPAATRGFIIPAPGRAFDIPVPPRAFDIQPHRHAA